MADVPPEPIMRIAMGFMAAKHLFAASAIGLFESLADGPATVDELAVKCGVPYRTLRISVDAMASLGLLDREGDRYHNSAVAAAYLSGGAGTGLRPMLCFWDRISYPLWANFENAVRAGEGQRQFSRFNEEEQQIFSAGVQAFSSGAATALAESYDFGHHRRVLDVGGGTGSFLISILRRYTGLQGTLFELPGACAVARQRLSGEPEGARISVVEGDLFKDPLPSGHDAMILANTIHVLSAEHNTLLLENMRRRVEMGARLLLVDVWMDAGRSQPPIAPLISGEFLIISGEGQTYAETEADEWLAQTGWLKLERKPLVGPSSVIIAEAV
jgi:SAM-dependent methyltransferase